MANSLLSIFLKGISIFAQIRPNLVQLLRIDQKAESRSINSEPGVLVVSIARNVAKVLRKHDNVRDWVEFAQQFQKYQILSLVRIFRSTFSEIFAKLFISLALIVSKQVFFGKL